MLFTPIAAGDIGRNTPLCPTVRATLARSYIKILLQDTLRSGLFLLMETSTDGPGFTIRDSGPAAKHGRTGIRGDDI